MQSIPSFAIPVASRSNMYMTLMRSTIISQYTNMIPYTSYTSMNTNTYEYNYEYEDEDEYEYE